MTDSLHVVGTRYLDFVVTKVVRIEELQAQLCELVHEPSGALVMHVHSDDPENLFCLSFKTLPESSNGVPHILEHAVLCGSRKFPVKDPFFAMNRRSLNTFMNAMTGADFTCYPAASQVEKDFYNLLDVYLDAVFHPLLREESFWQEGHRLEFEKPEDPLSGLVRKGVVYNEMKGALNSVDARMWHEMMKHLVPDLPYAHSSGGDPEAICHLTYAEFIAFYETYYHPSRCLFFFYGNLPLKQHLDFIYERTLKHTIAQPSLPPIPLQARFKAPVHKTMAYPIEDQEDTTKQNIYAFGWLTAPIRAQEEVLALSVLEIILMDTDVSLLKKALLESKLCIQAQGCMDLEMTEVPLVIICKGCALDIEKDLEACIFSTLSQIVLNGISEALVETAIHQLEFARTEINGEGTPFGLTLFMRSALAKQHGCIPEMTLEIHALFDKLRLHIKQNPRYLVELLEKHLLHNAHYVRLSLHPDPMLMAKEAAAEKAVLEGIYASLKEHEIEGMMQQSRQLSAYQEKVEHQNVECLPKVSLDDVQKKTRSLLLEEERVFGINVFHHTCFTNKIFYADLVFMAPQVSLEDLPYLSLLCALLSELGCGSRNYAENLEFIQAHTGGIAVTCSLHMDVEDVALSKPCVTIRGKSLERYKDKLLSLFYDIASAPDFRDVERINDLILQMHVSLKGRLSRSGMRYATQMALSSLSAASYIGEKMQGASYFKMLDAMVLALPTQLPFVIEKLRMLHARIFGFRVPELVLSCDGALYAAVKNVDIDFSHIKKVETAAWNMEEIHVPKVPSQALVIASPVAFTAYAMRGVSFLHPDAPALSLAAFLLENKVLLTKIREQGGAYGCGAVFQPTSGNFYLYAYRDPHLTLTLKIFKEALYTIAKEGGDAQELEEAKIGMIQHLDTPISPGNKGILAYSWLKERKSFEMRQAYRDRLLSCSMQDIQNALSAHLIPQLEHAVFVTCAGRELIEKENLEVPIFTI